MEPENLYLAIIDNLFDGVYFVDTERRITFWNKAAEDITGYKASEINGKFCQNNLLNHMDSDGRNLCNLGCPLFATIIDGKQRREKVLLQHKDGHRIIVSVNIFPYREDGKIAGAIEIFRPSTSTQQHNANNRIMEISIDKMRNYIAGAGEAESYITYKLYELKRTQRIFCLLLLNIDNFVKFNESYGYETGTQILNRVYRSICLNIRPTDFFGFWSENEFIGVFEIKKNYEATLLAEKIRILVAGTEMPYESGDLSVTASFGVTVAREDDTMGTLIQRAHDLMCQSKQRRKNCVTSDA